MKNQTISQANLKKIHEVACGGWKTRIEEYSKRAAFGGDVELSQSEVDEMFEASDDSQKRVLLKFFKRDKSILERVNSFEDACKVLSIEPSSVYNESEAKDEKAFKRLKTIILALNEGWKPNTKNSNENRFWNYFRWNNGVFSFYVWFYSSVHMTVPSALLLRTSDLANHCAKIALKDYEDLYA